VKIGKRQVEQLAMRAAADVEAFYAQAVPGPAPAEQVLMIQADGKGIVMRPDGFRPTRTAKAAAAKRKVAARLSPGEKNGRKRMAEFAAVTDVIPAPRTPSDIIAAPGAARADPPKAQGKWRPPRSPTTSAPSSPPPSTRRAAATPAASGPGLRC
jgi:hypothetical protein